MWLLIVVAAHVRSRDGVAYSADLEQMWVAIPSERRLLAQTMLVDLSDALLCLTVHRSRFPNDSMQRYTMTSSTGIWAKCRAGILRSCM